MVTTKLIKVSTKQGDLGESRLISSEKLPKSNPVFQAIGDVDELNSWLGLVATKFASEFAKHQRFIFTIQNTLFYLGAELAKSKTTQLANNMVKELEEKSDELQSQMIDNWHSKFLLPGGTELGGYLDIARTVCRRAERSVVWLGQTQLMRPVVIMYLNRLSDYLYVLRCYVNHAQEYKEKKFAHD